MQKKHGLIAVAGACVLLTGCGGGGSDSSSNNRGNNETTELVALGIAGKATNDFGRTKVAKVDIPDNFEGWDNSDHPADPSLHITDYGEGELHSILLADQGQLGLHAYYQEEYADHSSGPGETGHWEEIDWTVTLAGYDSSVSHYVCDADLASTDAVDLGVTGIALEYDWDTDDVKKGWTAYSLNAYSTACDIYLSTHPSTDNDYLIEGTFTATVGVEYAYICDNGSNDPYADPECPGALEWFYSDKQSVTITDGRFKMHIKEFEQPY